MQGHMIGPKQIIRNFLAVAAVIPGAVAEGRSALNKLLVLALAGTEVALAGAIRLAFYLLLGAIAPARSPQGRRRRKAI